MSFIEDVSQLDMLNQLGCRNALITELFDTPYINISLHDIEEGTLETCQTAMSLFALSGRIALVSLFCKLGKGKLIALENTVVRNKKAFDFGPQASLRTTGWVKRQVGSLACNLLFQTAKALYPRFDFDNDKVTAQMLINVTLLYNKRYGTEYVMDVNRVYSVFYGIENRILYPHQCGCNRFYIRSSESATAKCPWCRLNAHPMHIKEISTYSNSVAVLNGECRIKPQDALNKIVLSRQLSNHSQHSNTTIDVDSENVYMNVI